MQAVFFLHWFCLVSLLWNLSWVWLSYVWRFLFCVAYHTHHSFLIEQYDFSYVSTSGQWFSSLISRCRKVTLLRKCPYSDLFWSAFSRIWNESYLRIQSKCGEMWTRVAPNTDTFHAVWVSNKLFPFVGHENQKDICFWNFTSWSVWIFLDPYQKFWFYGL